MRKGYWEALMAFIESTLADAGGVEHQNKLLELHK
jgi:hypothetical protein